MADRRDQARVLAERRRRLQATEAQVGWPMTCHVRRSAAEHGLRVAVCVHLRYVGVALLGTMRIPRVRDPDRPLKCPYVRTLQEQMVRGMGVIRHVRHPDRGHACPYVRTRLGQTLEER